MTLLRLIVRGFAYHRRLHASLFLGVVLTAAILTGALVVGDSVKHALQQIAAARLGRIAEAMDWKSRFFSENLAKRIQESAPTLPISAMLLLPGTAATLASTNRPVQQVNRAQVIGVDASFWRLAKDGASVPALGPQEAAINEKTAAALGVKAGDDLSLRVTRYGAMPLDAPLSSREHEQTATGLVTVKVVLSDAQLGRFSLAANQTTPYNVFVDRAWLQAQTGQAGLANLILAGDAAIPPFKGGNGASAESSPLDTALESAWSLEDVGLRIRAHPSGALQLESSQIFVDDEVVRAATRLGGVQPTLTYLVNSIAKGERMTPYSFVEAGPVAADVPDDEAVINDWLAAQLQAGPGDTLDLAYVQLQSNNTFSEQRRSFTVHSVTPVDALAIERDLAPKFPGLSEVDSCSDWNIGMPMDAARLKDAANEAYWKAYGQTPKLLTTLKAGQEMWGSRFGSVTAIRFTARDAAELRKQLRDGISAERLGLRFVPVREIADAAVAQAIDFGGLFAGMSMFLIAAALILLGLLYVFGLQQRAAELGTLLSLGFTPRRVRVLFLIEALPSTICGACIGATAGVIYARVLLFALARLWPAAVAGTQTPLHVEPRSLVTGALAAILCAAGILLLAMWRNMRRPARELLMTDLSSASASLPAKTRRWFLALPTLCVALAGATVADVWATRPATYIEPFFSVGSFLLLAGLGYYAWLLMYLSRRPSMRAPRLWKVAFANLARRRGRSLSVAGLTACGCFLVISVSSMQANQALHASERSSGTGGFALFADTTVPIVAAPSDVGKTLGAGVEPLRVRDGDDAGCLNLNRARTPRLIGVNAKALAALGAFADSETWALLDKELPDGAIPALVGDSDTAMWGLQKKTGVEQGDILPYHDDAGRAFNVKLVGRLPMRLSVFQGSLLISDAAFTRFYPSEPGFRAFLIDAPQDQTTAIAARLNHDFERFGMQAVPAVQRLQEFYAVESTYLTMFLVLGALGLLLGAGGVAIVVLRNVFERRGEIRLLDALGYTRATVLKLLLLEHASLVLAGMAIGGIAALSGTLPLILLSQTTVSPGLQAILFTLIVAANVLSVSVALGVGVPRTATAGLRQE